MGLLHSPCAHGRHRTHAALSRRCRSAASPPPCHATIAWRIAIVVSMILLCMYSIHDTARGSPRTPRMAAPRSEGHALAFLAGDLVDVKGRGRAIVLETAGSAPAAAATAGAAAQAPHPFAGRVHVRFHEDGTTYWVNPARLRRMRPVSGGHACSCCCCPSATGGGAACPCRCSAQPPLPAISPPAFPEAGQRPHSGCLPHRAVPSSHHPQCGARLLLPGGGQPHGQHHRPAAQAVRRAGGGRGQCAAHGARSVLHL